MSKQWKPKRQTVALSPSRIRREPVSLVAKAEPRSSEQEMWAGVAGIVVLALACTFLIMGLAAVTLSKSSAAAPATEQFSQCYNGGANCVLDGDTILVDGRKVELASIDAPEVPGFACQAEAERGIAAAVRLHDLLNSGKVTLSPVLRDEYGRTVRNVAVDGKDVGAALTRAGLASRYQPDRRNWCAPSEG